MQNDLPISFAPWWAESSADDLDQELLQALQSMDRTKRLLAEAWLVENGDESMWYLEHAIGSGAVAPSVVGPCMAEILRRKLRGEMRSATTWLVAEACCC